MSKKMMIIIGSVFLAMLIAATLILVMIWSKINTLDRIVNPPVVKEVVEEAEEEITEAMMPKLGPIYSLDTFIVNLADKGGNRYLRLKVELELKDELIKKKIEERIPQIRDSLLLILPDKTVDDLKNNQGKATLRNEILARLDTIFAAGDITNIYFTEFVMQ